MSPTSFLVGRVLGIVIRRWLIPTMLTMLLLVVFLPGGHNEDKGIIALILIALCFFRSTRDSFSEAREELQAVLLRWRIMRRISKTPQS